jgi:glycosyltransferase involved in cell wall biosynthesis
MPEVYRACDISVLPSWREATSITGLESMASGLPLVATRVGGIPELVEEGETGLLVAPRDPGALGAAIASLVEAPERRREMGRRARARAVSRFAWSAIAADTAALYRETGPGRAAGGR